MSKKFWVVIATAGLALSATSFQAAAQNKDGYWTGPDNIPWRSGSGECWHASNWTKDLAIAECDPEYVKKPMAAPMPAPKPAPTPAPAPAPAPKPAPVPAKPVAQKVTVNSEVLFDFDKAVIKRNYASDLDELASKAKAMNLEVVIAIGHTDPIGASAYNQKLSVRRANAVKEYLVSKGIDPSRVYTEGKGESQQVKACATTMSRAARIACLAPNRRVELEVVGTSQ